MEKDTVLLNLEEYNKLKEYERAYLNSEYIVDLTLSKYNFNPTTYKWQHDTTSIIAISKEDLDFKLQKVIDSLTDQLSTERSSVKKLQDTLNVERQTVTVYRNNYNYAKAELENQLEEMSRFSILQFLSWKHTYKKSKLTKP